VVLGRDGEIHSEQMGRWLDEHPLVTLTVVETPPPGAVISY